MWDRPWNKPPKQPKINLMKKTNQPYNIGQMVWYRDGERYVKVKVIGYTKVYVQVLEQNYENFVNTSELSAEKPE